MRLKSFIIILIIMSLSIMVITTCTREKFDNPFNPANKQNYMISQSSKSRLMSGNATTEDLQQLIRVYKNYNLDVKSSNADNPNAVISMPETGKLLVTLRDNDAGWRSELYMKIGDETIQLFSDTRQGPLNVTTEYAYEAGTEIEMFLVTHTSWGEVWTNNANNEFCQTEYFENDIKWILYFEDDMRESSDMDFNDCVIEIQMAPAPFVDLSDCFNISIEYLDPHGYTPEGYTIYYIGETMNYNVSINIIKDNALFKNNSYVIYAIHEYYENITCDRWWYTSPPRPADEPQEIIVIKGDPLPNQDPPQSWQNIVFTYPNEIVLNGNYTSTLEVAAGNDQTHILIVHENENGKVELAIYDNPETGVFDPPPVQQFFLLKMIANSYTTIKIRRS